MCYGCSNRALNSAHELFCALSLNGVLALQASGHIDRSPSRALGCLPTVALTKDETPTTSSAGTDRIVLVLTGLAQKSLSSV